jgi:serine/threonine protein kinase
MIVANRYEIHEKIGEGCFGKIYKATNVRTGETVAIKTESRNNTRQLLKNESKILQFLNKVEGVPNMKWFYVDDHTNYMVISLLGSSLLDLKNKYKVFPMKWICEMGKNIVCILRDIHEKGILHRDVKPENFLVGLEDKNTKIFLIDYGFAKSYYTDNGKHIEMKKKTKILGTTNYVSVNVHELCEPSRRDDLESFFYMILFFYYGYLEWMNETDDNIIKELKRNVKNHKGLPLPLKNMIEYIQGLLFEEEPNYEYIIELLFIDSES